MPLILLLLMVVALFPIFVHAHPKQVQQTGDYEITYFSDPEDPLSQSPATLFVQVRDLTSDASLQVYHFLVEMIPPTGPRIIQHPLSNSTVFTFNQPGNWILLFEIGLNPNFATFDTTATFVADVSQAQTSGLLAAFANVIVTAVPKSIARWGHIFAVVLWLGTMLHAASTYRISHSEHDGFAGFAKVFRSADVIVAVAIGLLILTGVLRAFTHGLRTPSSLFESDFGLVLFAKISLAASMIALGIFNRTYLLSRLEGVSDSSGTSKAKLARRMYYLVTVEMCLGVTAILLGTVFTQIHTIT